MDRDEFLRSYSGGRRRVYKPILQRWADREKLHLDGADLRGADLREADLSCAFLTRADLREADLREADLSEAVLCRADLRQANLYEADLRGANLLGADLRKVYLRAANLEASNLCEADLRGADLSEAKLSHVNLSDADLTDSNLAQVDLTGAGLGGARFDGTFCFHTNFADVDLSEALGLDKVLHAAPSSISVSSLSGSRGRIPDVFLRGCGMAPWEALSASLYDKAMTPASFARLQKRIFDAWAKGTINIKGCFISYSWNDSRFVDKLRDRLMAEGINVYLDRRDMIAGAMQGQVWRAIQDHDIVLIVLSKDSVQSDWVENELDMARRKEKAEDRAVLCPVALDDAWRAKLDATGGPGDENRALWRTLQSKLVMDCSAWKTRAFNEVFGKLVVGLRVNYAPKGPPPA